jgi:predicted metal-dependent hydrolase
MSIPIDRLVRSRRKTVALVVERDGKLTVRAPQRLAVWRIHKFVESHADWIAKNQARLRAAPAPAPKRYTEGETFLYLGQAHPLHILASQRARLTFDGAQFLLRKSAQAKAGQAFAGWYKEQAFSFLSERVPAMANQLHFSFQKIRISSARTRWGSCSGRGTLSFTYRLIMAPAEVVDYVVLHRLEELMPDYKQHLAWLKKNGKYLM